MAAPRAGQRALGDQAAFLASTTFLPSIILVPERGLLSTAMRRGFIASGAHALEVDLQDAVGQRRTDDLDVIGKAEAALESARRDAAVEVGDAFARLAEVAADDEQVLRAVISTSFSPNPATAIMIRYVSSPVFSML